ncbi:hypothetical protein [Kribbella ginsengisoli]|uniref:hypothetical protein n=1 Tax=Kribbella ginsengisoli TaxID=363865 RepID=UPI0031DD1985
MRRVDGADLIGRPWPVGVELQVEIGLHLLGCGLVEVLAQSTYSWLLYSSSGAAGLQRWLVIAGAGGWVLARDSQPAGQPAVAGNGAVGRDGDRAVNADPAGAVPIWTGPATLPLTSILKGLPVSGS